MLILLERPNGHKEPVNPKYVIRIEREMYSIDSNNNTIQTCKVHFVDGSSIIVIGSLTEVTEQLSKKTLLKG